MYSIFSVLNFGYTIISFRFIFATLRKSPLHSEKHLSIEILIIMNITHLQFES